MTNRGKPVNLGGFDIADEDWQALSGGFDIACEDWQALFEEGLWNRELQERERLNGFEGLGGSLVELHVLRALNVNSLEPDVLCIR